MTLPVFFTLKFATVTSRRFANEHRWRHAWIHRERHSQRAHVIRVHVDRHIERDGHPKGRHNDLRSALA